MNSRTKTANFTLGALLCGGLIAGLLRFWDGAAAKMSFALAMTSASAADAGWPFAASWRGTVVFFLTLFAEWIVVALLLFAFSFWFARAISRGSSDDTKA